MPRSPADPLRATILAWVALAGLLVAAQQSWAAGAWRPVVASAMFVVLVYAGGVAVSLPERLAVRVVVLGGVGLQALALRVRPWSTDDFLRYVWDGRVLLSGVNPYRYPPGDPALAALRDPWLFPDGQMPALNHPTERTIYPPIAQAFFGGAEALPGGDGRGLVLQALLAVVAILTSLMIISARRAQGRDPRRVIWWAWCPTVILEAGGNAHIDTLAALFVVGAVMAAARHRSVWSGLLVGLATGTKLTPVLSGGVDVTGFLRGYAGEEATDRWDLLRPLLPDAIVPAVGLGLLVLLALSISAGWWHSLTSTVDRAAALLGGTWLLLTPAYPWYFLPLVALVALGATRLWLLPCAAAYVVYAAADLGHTYYLTRVIAYGGAAAALVLAGWRAERTARARDGAGSR